jgi:CHAT domain-containing protein/Tfp pilus assembly protein PilF
MRRFLLLVALPGLLGGVELTSGRTIRAHYRSGTPAPTFSASISAGETVRFTLDQGSNDLAVLVTLPDGRNFRLDEFEFGPEKITVTSRSAGLVQLVVVPAKGDLIIADFSISRDVSLDSAQINESESDAEALATRAKTGAVEKSSGVDSESILTAALDAWERLGDTSAVARTRLARGDVYFSRSDWAKARSDYRAAREECGAFLRCSAEAVNNAGIASLNLGDIDEAALQFSTADDEWRKLGLPQLEARTLSNLGLLHYQTSEFALALSDFGRARDRLASEHPLFLATILNNTGLVYLSLERYRDALSYFSRALTVAVRHSDGTKVQGRIRINMGRAHMLEGMLTVALRDEEVAAELADSISDISGKADSLNNSGQIYYRLHNVAAAENSFRQALDLYTRIGSPRGLSSTRFFSGLLAAERGDYAEALVHLDQSLEIRLSRRLQDEAAETYYQLALVEKKRGNRKDSLVFAEKAADMAEGLRFQASGQSSRGTLFAARRKYFEYLINETLADPETRSSSAVDAFRFAERARARILADTLTALPPVAQSDSSFSAERRRLWRQIAFKSARLAAIAVNQQSDEEGRTLRNEIEHLLLFDDQLAASTTSLADPDHNRLPPGEVAELQMRFLVDTDAFLEFWLGNKKSFLWVIRHDHVDVRELPARKHIEGQVQVLLALLTDINGRKSDPQLEASFQHARMQLSLDLNLVLDDLLPSRIIIIGDGALNRLPFAMLPLSIRSASGTLHPVGSAGLAASLIQSPSAAVFMALSLLGSPSASPKSVIAFGDPAYSGDDARVGLVPSVPADSRSPKGSGLALSRLAFSRIEMATVSEMVPPANRTLFSGFEATRKHFLSRVQGAGGLLLISTHVLADDDQPELSSIVFSMVDRSGRPVDGLVHLYDFNNGVLRLNSALVVLSTCDGASGREIDGEGLQSLARGFILSGARGVVASVTGVDSEGAAHFVRSFLRSFLATGGRTADSAISQARRDMSASKRWHDPYYWSTFALIAGE